MNRLGDWWLQVPACVFRVILDQYQAIEVFRSVYTRFDEIMRMRLREYSGFRCHVFQVVELDSAILEMIVCAVSFEDTSCVHRSFLCPFLTYYNTCNYNVL